MGHILSNIYTTVHTTIACDGFALGLVLGTFILKGKETFSGSRPEALPTSFYFPSQLSPAYTGFAALFLYLTLSCRLAFMVSMNAD